MKKLIVILLIGLFHNSPVISQNNLDKIKISYKEYCIEGAIFNITIDCSNLNKLLIPDLKNFEQVEVNYTDGFFPTTCALKCKKAGTHTISSIKAVVNNFRDTIDLQPVTVNVLPKETISKHNVHPITQKPYIENIEEIELEDFFVKIVFEKNKIQIKDSVLVHFLMYNSLENFIGTDEFSITPINAIQISKANENMNHKIVRYHKRNYEVSLLTSFYFKFKETGIYDSNNFKLTGNISLDVFGKPIDLLLSDNRKSLNIPVICKKIKVNK